MKKVWVNKADSFKEARDFDIKFWEKVDIDAKFSAMWELVKEFYKMKNRHGHKLRLQRSVQGIEQI